MRYITFVFLSLSIWSGLNAQQATKPAKSTPARPAAVFEGLNGEKLEKVAKTDAEWKKILNEQEFYVLRKAGTERAFTGQYNKHKAEGYYTCRGCGLPLFSSSANMILAPAGLAFIRPTKKVISKNSKIIPWVCRVSKDYARCGGHLGHVFDDGPKPTGLRYCLNSVSLDFVPKK